MALTQSLFRIPLILSTLTALSASTPIYIWARLEINTIVFIPIIISARKPESTHSAIKYFFVQAFASLIFLIGPIVQTPFFIFITAAMLIKLGAAPFHNWYPSVISNLSWAGAFILSTWQKIAPLVIISENTLHVLLLTTLARLNALIGGLGGLAQSEIRPLLAFSSIGHIGWIFYTIILSNITMGLYFISYFIHLIIIIGLLNQTNIYTPKDIPSLIPSSSTLKILFPLLLLSLGGLPPLLGFIPKFLVINLSSSSLILPVLLILGSYINIYYYITLIWGYFINNYQETKLNFSTLHIILLSSFILSTLLLIVIYGLNIYFQP